MRKFALSIAAFAILVPSAAFAGSCCQGHSSTITATQEQGVMVYRGTPMAAPAYLPSSVSVVENSGTQERLTIQSERIAAQSERIGALESQLETANRPQRRRRYGRRYYVPAGSFGEAPFVGHRSARRGHGYRGNRYYGGRRSGIKVTYN